MGSNGMNVNGYANVNGVKSDVTQPTQRDLSEQEKIIIDFKALDQDGDFHVSIDEVLRHQVDEYVLTGQLPEGKTIAEFLMDVQNAVEEYAGKDKRLNIDEYSAMLKSGVELARPSDDIQSTQGSVGYAYSEWGEKDENGKESFDAKYSPRAIANQKEIDEVTQMKKLAQENMNTTADVPTYHEIGHYKKTDTPADEHAIYQNEIDHNKQ